MPAAAARRCTRRSRGDRSDEPWSWFPAVTPGSVKGLLLGVADIDAATDELSAKGIEFEGIEQAPWGRFVQVADPDDSRVILQQNACGPPRRAWGSRARSGRHHECGIGTLRREAAARDPKEGAMQDPVQGTTLPALERTLDPGEKRHRRSRRVLLDERRHPDDPGMGGKAPSGQGSMGAIKRVAAGGGFLCNTYTAQGGTGMIPFAAKLPGRIFPIELSPGRRLIWPTATASAGPPGLELAAALQQTFPGGIFGGEGFILQRIGGDGEAWIELSGEVLSYDLEPGQTMPAHPGHVGLFEATVNFTVQRVPGLANRYLGRTATTSPS